MILKKRRIYGKEINEMCQTTRRRLDLCVDHSSRAVINKKVGVDDLFESE